MEVDLLVFSLPVPRAYLLAEVEQYRAGRSGCTTEIGEPYLNGRKNVDCENIQ